MNRTCRHLVLATLILAAAANGCATESHRVADTHTVASRGTIYPGTRPTVAIGLFPNRSPYMQGAFSSGDDRLGGQAKTILKTHLSQTGRFTLVDRDNMEEIAREAELSGQRQDLTGARYVVTGEVTEFGRRNTGDRQLWGILGRGSEQMAYSKVSLNVVDAATSQVVYSVQGAGEYALSDREVVGFGGTSGYDATLNGKVLDLSIVDAVDKIVAALEAGEWGR